MLEAYRLVQSQGSHTVAGMASGPGSGRRPRSASGSEPGKSQAWRGADVGANSQSRLRMPDQARATDRGFTVTWSAYTASISASSSSVIGGSSSLSAPGSYSSSPSACPIVPVWPRDPNAYAQGTAADDRLRTCCTTYPCTLIHRAVRSSARQKQLCTHALSAYSCDRVPAASGMPLTHSPDRLSGFGSRPSRQTGP